MEQSFATFQLKKSLGCKGHINGFGPWAQCHICFKSRCLVNYDSKLFRQQFLVTILKEFCICSRSTVMMQGTRNGRTVLQIAWRFECLIFPEIFISCTIMELISLLGALKISAQTTLLQAHKKQSASLCLVARAEDSDRASLRLIFLNVRNSQQFIAM